MQVAEKNWNCPYLHGGVSYIRGWIYEVSQGMILDMECLCKYKAGLKLTTRNLSGILKKTKCFSEYYLSLQTSSLKKNVESNLTLISEDAFLCISPTCLPSPPVFSQPKNGWTGTPNHSGGTGSPFSRKTCRAWQRGHGIPMESQKMHALENGFILWKSMETMGEETYQDDFD